MTRPVVEVADILRAQGRSFIDRHQSRIGFQQMKVMRAIVNCRTAALGGHIDKCLGCGEDWGLSFNSCRNRHCPKCQAQARARWIAARERELLETPYFHVVFSLPHELNALILQNEAELCGLLFRAVADTLVEVAANPEHLGAEIGFFGILHTWGQNMLFHPHIHCVVPSGGLAPGRKHWIRGSDRFFLPLEILKSVFRGKFVEGLKEAYAQQRLHLDGQIQHLARANCFAAFVRKLHRHKWVVYAKPPFGGPEQVLRYLGRYTHRVAISNHRLLAFDGDNVTFRWRDYAHGNVQRTMTINAEEFIRRFLLHVLPKGFVRIRHFGFMANHQRCTSLELCRLLLGMAPVLPSPETASTSSTRLCPICQAPLTLVKRLTAAEIFWRFVSTYYADTS
jgi:putative transposase/transposase-like zinc-binding protein